MGYFFKIDTIYDKAFQMNTDKELLTFLVLLKKGLMENAAVAPVQQQTTPAVASTPEVEPKPKRSTKVIFDKSTGNPFEVIFSERGFLLDGTRMSFEEIETAISKEYNIVLKNGGGTVLDAVKMQKILKYKDLY